MLILDSISGVCSDPGLANILTIVKKAMNLLWIMGPILAMIAMAINGFKIMNNPDEKKYKSLFKNSIMALLILFLLPFFINALMIMLDGKFDFASCWNMAERASTNGQESGYIDKNDKKPSGTILPNPNDYKPGEKPKENSSSGSSSSSSSNSNSNSTISKYIFVGDSRTVGMKQSVANNSSDVWSCQSSMGLNWMQSTGYPAIEGQISNGSAVIVLMGVNDLYQVNKYITYLNDLVSKVEARGGTLYFVSVNPTSNSRANMNSDIDSFNTKIRNGISGKIKYIDTNSYLRSSGFASGDGVHYNIETYKKIYNYIKQNV